jgi:hypothetical protein
MKKKTYIFMLSDKDRKRHEHLIGILMKTGKDIKKGILGG